MGGSSCEGPRPAPQPAPSSRLSALGYLCLGETQEGLRGAYSSCCLAAFCSFSSGGEVLPETQRPVFQGVLQEQGGMGVGGGEVGEAEHWVLWGLLGSSPARMGSRLASEGWGLGG